MAGKTAVLKVSIIGDAKGAQGALSDAEQGAAAFQTTMDKAAVGAGIALGAITAGTVAAIDAASELQQSMGAIDAVFGDSAAAVAELGEGAADRLGLAQSEYGNLATLIGTQLKNMGTDAADLVPQTDELIGLGADLAATFGGSVSDAVGAVSSLLKGERDPIEKYGVSLKQADIDARLAADGMAGLTGEAAKQAEAQATLALLMEQTASAQGMFASEADTAAGAQERANAQWKNALAALGENLLPIITEATKSLSGLAQWASDNVGLIQGIAVVIGIVASAILAITAAMKVYAAIQTVQTAIQWAQNAAWLANPITWIVLAVIALIAIIVLLWANWDEVWAWIKDAAGAVAEWFVGIWESISSWWGDMMTAIGEWWESVWAVVVAVFELQVAVIRAVFQAVADWFAGIFAAVGAWWSDTWALVVAVFELQVAVIRAVFQAVADWFAGIFAAVGAWWSSLWEGASNMVTGVVGRVRSAWQSVVDWFFSAFQRVSDFIRGIFDGIRNAASNVANAVGDQLGGLGSLFNLSVDPDTAGLLANGVPAYMTLDAAPTVKLAAEPVGASLGSLAALGAGGGGDTIVLTVNGAMDPTAVAEQIEDLLDKYRRKKGRR